MTWTTEVYWEDRYRIYVISRKGDGLPVADKDVGCPASARGRLYRRAPASAPAREANIAKPRVGSQ